MTLIIGDKNLSSWSMRAWLALKATKHPFKEIKVLLDVPGYQQKIRKYSPSGKVPALLVDSSVIWDSWAICEYAGELEPRLWPAEQTLRAEARAYCAEMHSGFPSLRNQLSMNIQLKIKASHLQPGTLDDINRIKELWKSALKKTGGPFLFGDYGIVDCFYAPVVYRFLSYGINFKDPSLRQYMSRITSHRDIKDWVKQARKEEPYQVPAF